MSRQTRVLGRAARDLEEFDAYLRRSAAGRAEEVMDDLLEGLERFPHAGPVVRDERLRRLGYRYLARGRYLVFYKVLAKQVRVYRVLHAKRAYDELL